MMSPPPLPVRGSVSFRKTSLRNPSPPFFQSILFPNLLHISGEPLSAKTISASSFFSLYNSTFRTFPFVDTFQKGRVPIFLFLQVRGRRKTASFFFPPPVTSRPEFPHLHRPRGRLSLPSILFPPLPFNKLVNYTRFKSTSLFPFLR